MWVMLLRKLLNGAHPAASRTSQVEVAGARSHGNVQINDWLLRAYIRV